LAGKGRSGGKGKRKVSRKWDRLKKKRNKKERRVRLSNRGISKRRGQQKVANRQKRRRIYRELQGRPLVVARSCSTESDGWRSNSEGRSGKTFVTCMCRLAGQVRKARGNEIRKDEADSQVATKEGFRKTALNLNLQDCGVIGGTVKVEERNQVHGQD